jgi:hypothetical protein
VGEVGSLDFTTFLSDLCQLRHLRQWGSQYLSPVLTQQGIRFKWNIFIKQKVSTFLKVTTPAIKLILTQMVIALGDWLLGIGKTNGGIVERQVLQSE